MQAGINRIFDLFDDDRTGFLSINNIRRVAKELGETMNASELEEMLQRAASNGKEISRDDFYNIITKKSI
jgi:Ca2+-binding EF-hand superfamily protein